MKIRLSQSKCGSTVDRALRRAMLSTGAHIAYRAAERSIHLPRQAFLKALHFGGAGGCLVIKTSEMKKPMRNVETQLVLERRAKRPRLAPRCFRADHNLAMLESDDVSGTGFVEKAPVQVGHATIGNKDDTNFSHLRKHFSFPSRKFETRK